MQGAGFHQSFFLCMCYAQTRRFRLIELFKEQYFDLSNRKTSKTYFLPNTASPRRFGRIQTLQTVALNVRAK